MASPDEVKDKEYINWLSVNLALYYMKSGVHTFIKKEVDCLHQSLVQKIYGGQTVSLPPCTLCYASRLKRDESGVWSFKKRCRSVCDAWLAELLALHVNPKSEEIYWNNSNVSSWPFQPWECAKVFMPKGQHFSNTGPAECDAQSLLMLLANCTHFHLKLSPKGLSLTQKISRIRNKIMHDGEMKLSDDDRMSFIQQIIQLLEDPVCLKSLEDCKTAVSNIHKIVKESLDLDLEVTAWRSVVNEFRLELGIQEKTTLDTVDSLKEEYKSLREQISKRFEDVVTKEDVQSVKNQTNTSVQQGKKHQDMPTTVTSHEVRPGTDVEDLGTKSQECETVIPTQRENNSDRKRKAVGNGISDSGIPEKMHRRVLNRCLPTLLMDLDFKAVSTYIQAKELFDDMTMRDISEHGAPSDKIKGLIQRIQQRGHNIYEKFKECLVLAKQEELKDMLEEEEAKLAIDKDIETATKGRPESESDGLKQLKRQTENKLGTVRELGCIPITQAAEAKKLLEEKRSIVIKGNPGEGKTTTALYLIDNEMYRDRRVVVYSPRDWKTVDTDWVDIVVLEDILGKYDFDPSCLQEWMLYLPTIQEHVDAGKLRVIITTRVDILAKADSKLGSLKLFSDHLSLTLSSEHLSDSEMMSILNRELQRHKKNMKEDEIEKCITNFSGLIGFPQCSLLFASDIKLFDRGPEFFKYPKEFFFENICNLEAEKFICLAFLFCHGEVYEEHLSSETMPKSSNDLFMELACRLHISKKKADITLLRNAYEILEGLYIEKSISKEIISGVLVKKTCVWFSHATVCEAVGQVLAKHSLDMVVKHCDPEYLYQRTYTAEAKDKTSENVFLPESMYSPLAERMVNDVVEKSLVKSVLNHSAFKQNQFLMKLKDVLHKGNRIKDFFMAIPYSELMFHSQDLSEGNCVTFLQHVLQSDDDTVKLVYRHFMEFLACTHNNNNSSDCWQCNEKQQLLELALYYHHFAIADKLFAMNACYTHVSLCNAARHGDLRRVQTIMEYLKRSEVFNPKCMKAKKALCQAYLSRSQDVIEILLQEDITLDSKHVVHAVKHGDISVLRKVVEHLKNHNQWHPDWDNYNQHGFFFNHCIYSNQFEEAHFSDPCSTALYITYCNEKLDMADYLLKNEAKVSLIMLAAVTEHSSKEAVARVIQHLKVNCIWDSHCDGASKVLGKAYAAHKYDVCDMLVQEGVSMTMKELPLVVSRFEVSLEDVKKAVTCLKDTDNWDPMCNYASKALEEASLFHNYDVCDLLVHEGVSPSMKNIPHVMMRSSDDIKKVVKLLKDTDSWEPKCNHASEALAKAFSEKKYDVCDLLIQEGVSLTIKNLPHVVGGLEISLEDVKKVVQHLKDTNNWDPKCEDASKALKEAYIQQNYDVCDLLVQEGVSLTMKNFADMVWTFEILEPVKKAVQHLKDTKNWDPKCKDASKALKEAYRKKMYNVCDLLVQEGVSLTMKNIPHVIKRSLDDMKKVVKLLKDTDSWDPKCDDASEALTKAYRKKKYDVCDLLSHEGVSLTMKNLPHVVEELKISLEDVKKAVQHLKDTNNWDPKCEDASKALEEAYRQQNYDVCDLLVQEGVSLTMKNLRNVVERSEISLKAVKKAVQHLKDTNKWDPKCEDASKALKEAYGQQKYDVCDLLDQEGVSLTMKNFADVVWRLEILKPVTKAVQHLKNTKNWDPKCKDVSDALELAYRLDNYVVCDLLVQEGVSLTMKNIPHVIMRSLDDLKKVVKLLKDTDSWDPMCDDASEALAKAYRKRKYDVCDLLSREGVLLTMKNLFDLLSHERVSEVFEISLEVVKKALQHLKDTNNWDPKCKDASEALEEVYRQQKYDVCDLLAQEGISLTMKNLLNVVEGSEITLKAVKKAVQHLKDTNNWDPKCKDASKALEEAYRQQTYDMCDLLVQEGVSLTMKNLPNVVEGTEIALKAVKKAVQHLKDTNNWDPKCEDASKVLEAAYREKKYDVCDHLIQERVSLTMNNFPCVVGVFDISIEAVKKALQNLKDTNNWDPKCDDASKALEEAYGDQKYDVCDLLNQEGVSLTMKNIPGVVYHVSMVNFRKAIHHLDKFAVCNLMLIQGQDLLRIMKLYFARSFKSLETVKKAIEHLKDHENWDAKSDEASEALANAYSAQNYDVCDLLLEEGVSLTMKNFPGVVGGFEVSLEAVNKAVQHLKATDNWDPKCDDASKALANAYSKQKYDVCDMLIQEGVSLRMQTLDDVVKGFQVSLEAVKKALKQLKDNDNWDPSSEHASKTLENAYVVQNYDVCDLLIQEGVSLSMENVPAVVYNVSLEYVKRAIQHLSKYDLFDLLVLKRVSLTMKNLPCVKGRSDVSLESVRKVIQHLKDMEKWDPRCGDASKALANAYSAHIYDVYNLLIQEGILPNNEESSSYCAGTSDIIESF